MKRFILLTFGFLAWAFYEMSGGSDFQPKSVQMAALAPIEQSELPEVDSGTTETAAVASQDTAEAAEDTVTRVSLNLTQSSDVAEAVQIALQSDNEDTTEIADTTVVPVSQEAVPTNVISSVNTPAIIPSLIAPNDTGAVEPVAATLDIRSVSGNRVNVRGGPGTDFEIVTRLNRGDAVEILADNGNGWVKMRPVDGGPEGWMADFLLTSG